MKKYSREFNFERIDHVNHPRYINHWDFIDFS